MNSNYNKVLLLFASFFFCSQGLASAIIEGNVKGYKSLPPLLSHITVMPYSGYDKLATVIQINPNGEFQILLQDTGFYEIKVSAVDHKMLNFPIFIKNQLDTVRFDIQLQPNSILDTLKEVQITGNFNNYGLDSINVLKQMKDGTYALDLHYTRDTLIYQVYNVEGDSRTTNGTMADYYLYDNGGDYYSVILTKPGEIKLIYEPKKLLNPTNKANIKFADKDNEDFYLSYMKILTLRKDFLQDRDKNTPSDAIFEKLKQNRIDAFEDLINQRLILFGSLLKSKNEYHIQALYQMEYLNYSMYHFALKLLENYGIKVRTEPDTILIKDILKNIPASSPLWMKFAVHNSVVLSTSFLAGHEGSEYLEDIISVYPDTNFRKNIIDEAFNIYLQRGDSAKAEYYLGRLLTEFPDDPHTNYLRAKHSKINKIRIGNKIPEFVINDYFNGIVLNNGKLLGKYVLFDFWATWCGPCIAEIPYIHEACQKYQNKNFILISVSFDHDKNKYESFIKKKVNIPGHHILIKEGFSSSIAKAFEILSLPRMILVNPDGKILAIDHDLRGAKLLSRLKEILN